MSQFYGSFRRQSCFVILCLLAAPWIICAQTQTSWNKDFAHPPDAYKPMPFWHINGELNADEIARQMRDAKELAGFSGLGVLPLNSRDGNPNRKGTTPEFLTEAYFEQFQHVLDNARELDMEIILYDDVDFPSGMAGGQLEKQFPDHTRKRLDLERRTVTAGVVIDETLPSGRLLAAVAMDTLTKERIDLRPYLQANRLNWKVPRGSWKLLYFMERKDTNHKKYLVVDYMDTTAVRHFINLTYDQYYERFSEYFGNTIKVSFFDDIGWWRHPRAWTPKFDEKFAELNGYDPHDFYPALWYDIGEDTEAVRNAFFRTRAELLAEGFPKLVAEWASAHGIQDTGHPPGNYDPTPIDMNGDIFKFFRYTAIPLTDAIIDYQFGQDGHKLISSAADYHDRPVVATEIYGAYKESIVDSLMLYRSMMDLFTRGVNRVVPHGLWYDSAPEKIHISPLVSPYSEKLAPALPAYSEFVGRTSQLLQGGRRVAEIGVLYPFESLAGWYTFENPDNPRQGFFVAPETDYQTVSGWLTNALHRDFTFVHPELFLTDKYVIDDGEVKLENAENHQAYEVMILTGSKVISVATLQKLRDFQQAGGKVIATTQLPTKSAERGQDHRVVTIIEEMFGKNSCGVFLPNPTPALLAETLDRLSPAPDIRVITPPRPVPDFGKFSYIHKVKEGRDIYFFANSSDKPISSEVLLRGHLRPEKWDPHTGMIDNSIKYAHLEREGEPYTLLRLELAAVRSVFYIANN